MVTSDLQLTLPISEEESTSLPAVSLASPQATPGSDSARRMTVGSGRQLSLLFDSSTPLGAFSKILMESPAWTNSEEYSWIWQIWDTKSGCSAFQLTVLEPNTSDEESLLLPTPNVPNGDRVNPPQTSLTGAHPDGKKRQVDLREAVRKLWRTPNNSDATGGPMDGQRRLAQGHHLNLAEQAKTPILWPTPQALLNDQVGGSLNPRFVEQLMGFPIDHTDLKP